MCDDHDFDAMLAAAARSDELTRRRFAALSLGVGVTAVLPRMAGAAAVTESDVEIKTADGVCDAVAVLGTPGERAEDEHVERALEELNAVLVHGCR